MSKKHQGIGLVALLACAIGCGPENPRHFGPVEHTGMGTIRKYQPETTWHHAQLTHETDGSYVKQMQLCDGSNVSLWVGRRIDLQFRWAERLAIDDQMECYQILGPQP